MSDHKLSSTDDCFIDGGKIYLRSPTESDVLDGDWYKWSNDQFISKYTSRGIFPNSVEDQLDYFRQMKNSTSDILFAIIDKESNKHIGSVGLHNINWIHRVANLGILIGDRNYMGKGYGKIAWNMITWYGLYVLNLQKINAQIMIGNIASLKSAEASGYKLEGKLRNMYFKNGEYLDVNHMGILPSEFKKLF